MSESERLHAQVKVAGNGLEGRPDAARVSAGARHDFRPMSPTEKIAYRRWMRGALILYGAVVVALGGLVVAGNSSSAIPDIAKVAAHVMLAAGSR